MSIFPTKILLATDGSEEAALAARTAADIAQKTGSELHLAYTEPIPPPLDTYTDVIRDREQAEGSARKRAQQLLDEQVKRIEAAGGTVARVHFEMGRPDEEIVALAEELGVGLIVIGSRGRGGIRRALMGSVSDSVVRHAHCPVLVVRKEKGKEELVSSFPTKILLATDGSEEAILAARAATEIANETGSELHVVHVGPLPSYTGTGEPLVTDIFALGKEELEEINDEFQRLLDTQVEQIKASGGTVRQAHLRIGRPDEEIIALGEEIGAGLIVIGSRGLGGMRRALMGGVSNRVVRHAHCPVLVVREEEQLAAVAMQEQERGLR